ncbi:F0F1 ATP synthase subunit B' [Alkalilacustris brevis]|uniref:F0F1 ATP synthase subunit B' n=1 Tax=Alkalilacustris brevis TaxID=2026338 RepID=UPI000E0DB4BE|nr:F0F1 ATP synthase subunit B' [Alkalilacustris brevis]
MEPQASELGSAPQDVGPQDVGMPQIDFATFPNQIFWLVVTLVVIYLILSRMALPRIAAVLAERRGTITNDVARAEELKRKAEEAEEAYQKALADARTEAARIVDRTKAEMQERLDEAMAKADAEIAARTAESEQRIAGIRKDADAAIEEVARDTVKAVLESMGHKADGRSVNAAVSARLKQGDAA